MWFHYTNSLRKRLEQLPAKEFEEFLTGIFSRSTRTPYDAQSRQVCDEIIGDQARYLAKAEQAGIEPLMKALSSLEERYHAYLKEAPPKNHAIIRELLMDLLGDKERVAGKKNNTRVKRIFVGAYVALTLVSAAVSAYWFIGLIPFIGAPAVILATASVLAHLILGPVGISSTGSHKQTKPVKVRGGPRGEHIVDQPITMEEAMQRPDGNFKILTTQHNIIRLRKSIVIGFAMMIAVGLLFSGIALPLIQAGTLAALSEASQIFIGISGGMTALIVVATFFGKLFYNQESRDYEECYEHSRSSRSSLEQDFVAQAEMARSATSTYAHSAIAPNPDRDLSATGQASTAVVESDEADIAATTPLLASSQRPGVPADDVHVTADLSNNNNDVGVSPSSFSKA